MTRENEFSDIIFCLQGKALDAEALYYVSIPIHENNMRNSQRASYITQLNSDTLTK